MQRGGLGDNFNERIYRLLHGNTPEADYGIQQYVPNQAMTAQTQNTGGGNLQNPSTDSSLGLEWNVAKLKQLHPDWDDATINGYMNQNFNWQAAQALTKAGVWQPNQQSRDWTNYLAEKARLEAEARERARQYAAYQQWLASQQSSGGGYSGGSYSGGGSYTGSSSGGNPYSDPDSEVSRTVRTGGWGNPLRNIYGQTVDRPLYDI